MADPQCVAEVVEHSGRSERAERRGVCYLPEGSYRFIEIVEVAGAFVAVQEGIAEVVAVGRPVRGLLWGQAQCPLVGAHRPVEQFFLTGDGVLGAEAVAERSHMAR